MTNGRRTGIRVYIGLLLWLGGLFHPVGLFAGHGVEGTVDNLAAARTVLFGRSALQVFDPGFT
jgi:hypothetical protein